MSYGQQNPYQASASGYAPIAAHADTWERTQFIRRTYLHLAGAIGAFAMIAAVMLTTFEPTVARMVEWLGTGRWNWLLVIGAFMGVGYLANHWASSNTSKGKQYAGLGLYVIAEAFIFLPLLYIANRFYPGSIQSAAVMTGVIFGGLTLVVMMTKKDFSFLRNILWLGSLAAFGFILCSIFFSGGGLLGPLFATVMIVLMAGYILYFTSNVLLHYHTSQPVAASLALFASVATMFYYVLILFMGRD